MKQRCEYKLDFGRSGQVLVILLFFMVITIMITTASVTLIILNSHGASKSEQGEMAYEIAEAGAENALLRLLRDSTYQGETLTVGEGAATITVTGTDPLTITSVGSVNTFSRTVRVVAGYTDYILTIESWNEVH